jgi:hypothetical protein
VFGRRHVRSGAIDGLYYVMSTGRTARAMSSGAVAS